MYDVTSIPTSSISRDELSGILNDYLALEQARVFRRLFVIRCGLLAGAAGVIGLIVPNFSALVRWLLPLFPLVPAFGAWAFERWLARRLARRLNGIGEGAECKKS